MATLVFALLLVCGFVPGAGPALAQSPTPTQTSSGLNFRDYIKIDALGKSLTAEMVIPGQTFYADLSSEITWIGDSNPPFPISLLKNWSVTALYQIAGVPKNGGGEQVLGTSEMTIGPFRDVNTGDKFGFEQRPSLMFSDAAPLGEYTVVVRPVGAQGGPLNAFGMAWPLIKGGLPQEYAIGAIDLVTELPTPTPTPAPSPIPTSTPTVAPAPTAAAASPAATPVPAASPPPPPAATPAAVPTPAPQPTAPSQEVPGAGGGSFGTIWVAVLVLALVGLVVGVSLNRRFKAPEGRL